MASPPSSDRGTPLLLGAALGLGVSLLSVAAAAHFLRRPPVKVESSATLDGSVVRSLQDEVSKLTRDRERLLRHVQLSEQTNIMSVPEGTSSKLSVSEVERLRAFFNMFDADSDGKVEVSEIQLLHEKLGEPLTDEEAAEVVTVLDPTGLGVVTFGA
jgi:hypothetical protein